MAYDFCDSEEDTLFSFILRPRLPYCSCRGPIFWTYVSKAMRVAEFRGESNMHQSEVLFFLKGNRPFPSTAKKGLFLWQVLLFPQLQYESNVFPLGQKTREGCGSPKFLLERFSGKFRRCWKILLRFSGSTKCCHCQGLGTFWQGKRLLANWARLQERCWIFSSETATAFLSSSDLGGKT